jgi:ParB-like chromosome segregation protein Spo0J
MYDRMIHEHGYSVRKLAQKLGKDKGYLENRLRLADAPPEVRQLVSVRKDTLSHAYELLKVEDPKKRRRLAEQVARGELTLVKLREKIEGRAPRQSHLDEGPETEELNGSGSRRGAGRAEVEPAWSGPAEEEIPEINDESLVAAKQQLSDAVEDLVAVLRPPDVVRSIPEIDRANLAKYLTIAKLKLENAIAVVRNAEGN